MQLNVMDSPGATGADSTKLLMEEKHDEDSDNYRSARSRPGLVFDCEACILSGFGNVDGARKQR